MPFAGVNRNLPPNKNQKVAVIDLYRHFYCIFSVGSGGKKAQKKGGKIKSLPPF